MESPAAAALTGLLTGAALIIALGVWGWQSYTTKATNKASETYAQALEAYQAGRNDEADRLFGDKYRWSVLAGGRHQMNMAAMAVAMGGNVRVGLEDSLYAGPGKLATSNAEQVRMIRSVIEGLSLQIATPDEARDMLGLKGASQVEF